MLGAGAAAGACTEGGLLDVAEEAIVTEAIELTTHSTSKNEKRSTS
jgi:hypothetical protein